MYYLEEMCCFCLKKFYSDDTKFTDFEHMSCFLPDVSAVIKLDEESTICKSCNENVEMICGFVKNCYKNMAVLHSYKSKLKGNIQKIPHNIKIQLKDEKNLKTNKNQADEEMPLSDTFPNSNFEEIKFLSENEIKIEVEKDSDFEILSINNIEINEEMREMDIKEEYSSDLYDVLKHGNPFTDIPEDNLKTENDSDFEDQLTNADEIKMEIVESDIKNECFGDLYENILGYSNQLPEVRVGDEFHVAIGDTPELERVSKERLLTITADEMLFQSNELNFSVFQDSEPAKEQEVEESASTSKYKCDLCKERFTNVSHLKLHDCVHEKLSQVCEKSFARKSHFVYHERVHTGEKPFSCQVCEKSFTRKSDLTRHKRMHTGEKPYSCQICEKSFTQKSDLTRHKRMHSGEKPYSCRICEKSFAQKSHLVVHELCHTGEKPYFCQVCKKSFLRKSHLTRHERMHTGEKPYSCGICEKSFTQKSDLVVHERCHTEEKPYFCKVCKISFIRKSLLTRHERMHTGEKLYSCQVCEKSFTLKSGLINHERLHSGEKLYSCHVCEKLFTQNSQLAKHKRIHTGEKSYFCQVCEKSFRQKYDLVVHERCHTGEKPYSCQVCEKSFSQRSHLTRHKLMHTGEKPYSCQVCVKSFKRKSSLVEHDRLHASKKPY